MNKDGKCQAGNSKTRKKHVKEEMGEITLYSSLLRAITNVY